MDAARVWAQRVYGPGEKPRAVAVQLENGEWATLPYRDPAAPAAPADPHPTLKLCDHSYDFRAVVWFGTPHKFTEKQAAVVAVLWADWERGCPDVGAAALMVAAGSETGRMDDLFRGHAAWGTMIVKGASKGSYRLEPAA